MEAPQHEELPEEQKRRQYREGVIIIAAALGVSLFVFFQTRLPQLSGSQNLASNILFVLLINVNIILLVLLIFLVGRNLIKLLYDRQRNRLGSHLRLRLVLAFVAIALFPSVLLFTVGIVFMTRTIENWFAVQMENSIDGTRRIARTFYARVGNEATLHAHGLAIHIAEQNLLAPSQRQNLQDVVTTTQRQLELDRVAVFTPARALLAQATPTDTPEQYGPTADAAFFDKALHKESARHIESVGATEMVSAAAPILAHEDVIGVVVIGYFIPHSVTQQSAQVADTYREYRYLRVLKQPIKNNYTIAMSLVTLVVVFSAIWIGLYLAKKITIPLQRLAEGTREVAQGHWAHRIAGEGKDEIGTLVAAFNRMTAELYHSHHELEARRRYMEILLANINAGVVSLDRSGLLTTVNRAAEQLLGIQAATVTERDYREVFAPAEFGEVRRMVREVLPVQFGPGEDGLRESQGQIKLTRDGQMLSLLVTGTPLTDDRGEVLGMVCFFEDVTQIVRVERMEAWREVACRIAHEIKNPLTPIHLAAQRLHRRFAPQIGQDREVFDECTRSIGLEVEAIKKLVNEFSTFARLPAADHRPENLNAIVQEAIVLFTEAHKDVSFGFLPDHALPPLELDREGMKRVIRNLLDNAVAACHAVPNGIAGRIEVVTRYLRPLGIARLEVADTGCGITPEVKDRLFEPYFSTKKDGTGLGLAIVATVVADHQAFIRVRDNEPRGSRFIIELPGRRGERRATAAAATTALSVARSTGNGK